MEACQDLIPPPAIVRDRLASNCRERRLLRSLLGLSIRAAELTVPQREVPTGDHRPSAMRD